MTNKQLLFLILLLFFGQATNAAVLPSSVGGQERILLTPYFSILKDASGKLTPEEAIKEDFTLLRIPKSSETYSFGYLNDVVWLKLSFKTNDKAQSMILEQGIWYVHSFKAWLFGKGKVQFSQTGSHLPSAQRPIKAHSLAVPFELVANTEYEILLRMDSKQILEFSLILWEPGAFWAHDTSEIRLSSMYMGIYLIIILYAFILSVGIKDATFAWYGILLILLLASLGIVGGEWNRIFFFENPQILYLFFPFTRVTAIFVFIRFIQSFSQSKDRCPQLHRAANGLAILYPVTLVSFLFVEISTAQYASALLAVIVVGFSFAISVKVYLQGHREAKYAVLATGLYGISNVLIVVRQLGLVSTPAMGLGAAKIFSLIDITLLALALASKFKVIREEHKVAQNALFKQAQEHTDELEGKVEQRTLELSLSQQELEKANEAKDQFFSILAHDLRGPIGALNSTLECVHRKEIDWNAKVAKVCANSSEQVYQLLENLLIWAQSQQNTLQPNPTPINVNNLFHHSRELVTERAAQKNIEITISCSDDLSLLADEMMTQTILRNLLSNSLKFTEKGKNIYLKAQVEGDQIVIEVQDEGKGMEPEKAKSLLAEGTKKESFPGTDNEAGSGFGLTLVQEFVAKNQGRLELTSEMGVGSTFRVYLPLS